MEQNQESVLLKVAAYNEDSKYKMLIIKIQGVVTW